MTAKFAILFSIAIIESSNEPPVNRQDNTAFMLQENKNILQENKNILQENKNILQENKNIGDVDDDEETKTGMHISLLRPSAGADIGTVKSQK